MCREVIIGNGYYTGFQGVVQTEPLGIEYVAGAVSDLAKNVQIHDDRIRPGGWRDKVRQSPPDLVGIGCQYTADVPVVKNRALVGPDVPIVVGGHHIGLRLADAFSAEIAAIARGPGDQPFREFVKAWGTKRSFEDVREVWYRTYDGEYVANMDPIKIRPHFKYNSPLMDERPNPRRDLMEEFRDDYFFLFYPKVYSVETALGCSYRCSFCSVWNHHQGAGWASGCRSCHADIVASGGRLLLMARQKRTAPVVLLGSSCCPRTRESDNTGTVSGHFNPNLRNSQKIGPPPVSGFGTKKDARRALD